MADEKKEADKLPHAAVRYVDDAKQSAIAKPGQFCSVCDHYIKVPNGGDEMRCTGVKSPINPRGYCVRYD